MALRKWSSTIISDARLKFLMAQEVILCLDVAQELRELSNAELSLRGKLKKRLLGWAIVERARKKQCSRITNIKEGDANTKLPTSKRPATKKLYLVTMKSAGMGRNTPRQARNHL